MVPLPSLQEKLLEIKLTVPLNHGCCPYSHHLHRLRFSRRVGNNLR